MGFFSRLDKVDGAVNRGYARWGKKIWLGLGLAVALYGGWMIWAAIWGPPTGGVTLIIHNQLDRPILGFSVNGVAGSNASAHGGGGATCCGNVNGKTAEVIWVLSTTRQQYDSGLRKETRKVTIPLPERKWEENYLHVYFLPDDKVRLWWGNGFIHPKAETLQDLTSSTDKDEK